MGSIESNELFLNLFECERESRKSTPHNRAIKAKEIALMSYVQFASDKLAIRRFYCLNLGIDYAE
jgi:hypothetical protein